MDVATDIYCYIPYKDPVFRYNCRLNLIVLEIAIECMCTFTSNLLFKQ